MPRAKPLHDPQVLRAISHPVRNRILDELGARGSLRAADIARDLGIPANQASFHLRQLAKYGLIEEDADAARDRRDRVWRSVSPDGFSVNFDDFASQPGGAAAAAVFRRSATAWAQQVVQQAYEAPRDEHVHRSITSTGLHLSREEAAQLSDDINDLIDAWSLRTRDRHDVPRDGPDGEEGEEGAGNRRTYLYFGVVLPHPGPVEPAPPVENT